jgi:hypothetical protein
MSMINMLSLAEPSFARSFELAQWIRIHLELLGPSMDSWSV